MEVTVIIMVVRLILPSYSNKTSTKVRQERMKKGDLPELANF